MKPVSYLPCSRDPDILLPHSICKRLPEGHLAYFINNAADTFDLQAFRAWYALGGPRNQPFPPAMMVKVLIYGYATGRFIAPEAFNLNYWTASSSESATTN